MKITIFAMEIVNNGSTCVEQVNIEIMKKDLPKLRQELIKKHDCETIFFKYKHKATKAEMREYVYEMYNGRCAYSGTELLSDWQIDHIEPILRGRRFAGGKDTLENMLPAQKIINHYKGNLELWHFRQWIETLHIRLAKLPKNPKIEKSKKRKKYLLEVASFFGITPAQPFKGKFYFETINK
jgi:hypothetical protein